MPDLEITFNSINASTQINDSVYFVNNEVINDGFSYQYIGPVVGINGNVLEVDIDSANGGEYTPGNPSFPGNPVSYFFVVKNNEVNKSNVKGYYAETTFLNNSTAKAELFSVGSEIQQSSK
tara:strand:- start:20 stop:382 length:363 start_codon:yes stop_codon:yes gene_type:complete